MINFKLKNRGESLVEVLVAIGILGVVLITSFILLNRGISTNITVKNKILAINIAREGIEGMRNIRDTNWLRYSGDRRNKWLKVEDSLYAGDFDIGLNEMYTMNFDVYGSENIPAFRLNRASDASDEVELDLSSSDFPFYKLYKDSDSRYTHNNNSGANSATIFYRQIQLTAEQPPECSTYTAPNNCTNARLHVISRVQWREPLIAGKEASASDLIGTIVMETYLYDYLGRDEY